MNNNITYIKLLKDAEKYLKNKKISEYKNDAFYILSEVFMLTKSEYFLIKNEKINNNFLIKKYIDCIKQRSNNIPCQYILGYQFFYGYKYIVNKNVLIPRKETEILVEKVLDIANNSDDILDLCSGSGCIGISIKKENKNLNLELSEYSKKAIKVINENLKINDVNLKIYHSNLFNKINKRYNIICSNPPYIKNRDIKSLDKSVKKYEPKLALKGGITGIKFYKTIISRAHKYLKTDGYLVLEIGYNQAKKIKKIAEKTKRYRNIEVIKDYNNLDRIVIMQRN